MSYEKQLETLEKYKTMLNGLINLLYLLEVKLKREMQNDQ